jgi:hypothetical protein
LICDTYRHSESARELFSELFTKLEEFSALEKQLADRSSFVGSLGSGIILLATNASVEAGRHGKLAGALAVLAGNLGSSSLHIANESNALRDQLGEINGVIKGIIYDVAAANLQVEMSSFFLREIIEARGENAAQEDPEKRASLVPVREALLDTTERILKALNSIKERLLSVGASGEELNKIMRTLRFVHMSGKVEVSRFSKASHFSAILDDICTRIEQTGAQLLELDQALGRMRGLMGNAQHLQGSLAEWMRRAPVLTAQ